MFVPNETAVEQNWNINSVWNLCLYAFILNLLLCKIILADYSPVQSHT